MGRAAARRLPAVAPSLPRRVWYLRRHGTQRAARRDSPPRDRRHLLSGSGLKPAWGQARRLPVRHLRDRMGLTPLRLGREAAVSQAGSSTPPRCSADAFRRRSRIRARRHEIPRAVPHGVQPSGVVDGSSAAPPGVDARARAHRRPPRRRPEASGEHRRPGATRHSRTLGPRRRLRARARRGGCARPSAGSTSLGRPGGRRPRRTSVSVDQLSRSSSATPSAPSTAAKRPARSQVHPARRPATSAQPAIWRTAAASASPAPVSRDHTPAQASARRSVGTTAASTSGHSRRRRRERRDVGTPPRRNLLADDLRPPVREPEDERGAERGRRHEARVLSSLEGDADDRGHEKRPVDGCSKADVVPSGRSGQRSPARLDPPVMRLPHGHAAPRRSREGLLPGQTTRRRGTST